MKERDGSTGFRDCNGNRSLERRDKEEVQVGESPPAFHSSKGFLKLLIHICLFYGEKIPTKDLKSTHFNQFVSCLMGGHMSFFC